MLIRKFDHRGRERARYEGDVIERTERAVRLRAVWRTPPVALTYVTIETGDIVIEDFYADQWRNVMAFQSGATGKLKGWYANVTRPAQISDDMIDWVDLALDVWMSADGDLRILDEDEFEALVPELEAEIAATALAEADRAADDLRARWRAHANDRIAAALGNRGWTIGTAESCTGGLIGDTLTDRSGCSSYFMGGIISYDNRVKRERLGVMAETLETAGAVSAETALEMARGARRALGVDMAVSATGIAGPGGGSADKPVGLVWLAVSAPGIERAEQHVWPFDRAGNKRASADAALRLVLRALDPEPAT
jgi:PncC family amidohydrolase